MIVASVENVSKNEAPTLPQEKTSENMEGMAFGEGPMGMTNPTSRKPSSPAQDLRDIQMLLVSGIFPGNMAPAIVKAYSLLEQMAIAVENQNKVQETK